MRPLTKLTQKDAWHPLGEEELEAFERAKALMLSSSIIIHYSPLQDTRVETDISDGVVARVLN